MKSVNRKLMILEALVHTLEQPHMQSVTTKILAEKCDITESALYKHYKNKQEIFEQLFRHVEQTIMDKTNEVKFKFTHPTDRIRNLFMFLVMYLDVNPGFCRLLNREGMLHTEQEIKTLVNLLLAQIEQEFAMFTNNKNTARLIMIQFEGIINRYIRTEFTEKPSSYVEESWQFINRNIL
tara:strand:+ start:18712 stop:19251 length:540 start_codon:yes stop_codon:yes gene_type:complete